MRAAPLRALRAMRNDDHYAKTVFSRNWFGVVHGAQEVLPTSGWGAGKTLAQKLAEKDAAAAAAKQQEALAASKLQASSDSESGSLSSKNCYNKQDTICSTM